jgi:hypothetical protein
LERKLLTWTAAVVFVTVGGIAWEIAALNTFAKRSGDMRGMIANPRPLDYVNYDYTRDGRRFVFWAFKLPLAATGFLLLITGVTGSLVLSRSSTFQSVLALWACILACVAITLSVTAYYYLIVTNFFI